MYKRFTPHRPTVPSSGSEWIDDEVSEGEIRLLTFHGLNTLGFLHFFLAFLVKYIWLVLRSFLYVFINFFLLIILSAVVM